MTTSWRICRRTAPIRSFRASPVAKSPPHTDRRIRDVGRDRRLPLHRRRVRPDDCRPASWRRRRRTRGTSLRVRCPSIRTRRRSLEPAAGQGSGRRSGCPRGDRRARQGRQTHHGRRRSGDGSTLAHRRVRPVGARSRMRASAATLDHMVLPLTPGSLAVLRVLAESPGVVRSREELLRALPGESNDPHTAEVAVARLREAIGSPSIVKRGYQLFA